MKFDGKDYPNLDPNATPGFTSSIRRVSERTLEMTDKINGKVRYTQQIELSSDLKTLTMTVHTLGRSEPNILVFERQ
jgi:lipopolysaccharide/colanic/teichoic acid biosynthesis glycosyltransferase